MILINVVYILAFINILSKYRLVFSIRIFIKYIIKDKDCIIFLILKICYTLSIMGCGK